MFNEEVKKLLDNLNDSQITFIEDADAEGLEINDIEFEQMLNERALSGDEKEGIIQFYKDKAKLKTACYLKELHEIERTTIEDLLSEGLYPGDIEFEQMLNERTVNKENIYKYFDKKKEEFLINYSKDEKNFIEKMIKDGIKIGDKEFDERINNTKYSRDKIVEYYNNIKWINKNNDIIKEIDINKKKKEEEKKRIEVKNKKEDKIKDDDFDEEIDEIDEIKTKPINKEIKVRDPYEGLDYYERLSLYAKEKEARSSRMDSYDDELRQMKKMNEFEERQKEINKLKKQKNWLYRLKDLFKNEDLDDKDIKKLGFINIIFVSIITIILCIIFTFVFKIFV